MPAALLTMFIKRALVTKVIEENSYRLIEPGVALARLNEDMVAQEMSNFQFATCCYGLLNTRTLELRLASAGHPAPMRITPDGQMQEVPVAGPLLGVFADKEFKTSVTRLNPGEKLLLYSDGVEVAFVNEGPDKPLRFREEFGNLADYNIQTICTRLLDMINREEGSLHPRDDVTILGIEVLRESGE
jgi:sigma-B regulation protein RsbU (phosphoserine phosphatase)